MQQLRMEKAMRVLVVDNNSKLSGEIAGALKARGVVFDQIRNSDDAMDFSKSYEYDVIMLDAHLAGIDGLELLRRLRAGGDGTPVLMISDDVSPRLKVKAFSLGADDVITAPFDAEEFGARLNAVIRRSRGFNQPVLSAGPVRLNLDSREVSVGDKRLHLTVKEYAILELLFLRKGAVLRKEVFLNHLYGGLDEPEIKIIDVLICKLRKKLAKVDADNLIRTVWGQGYMLREPNAAPALPGGSRNEERTDPVFAAATI
jgi:two-component system cell cycle response regulator CtrA